MKKYIFALFLVIAVFHLFAQTSEWSWVSQAGGSYGDYGSAIATDENGNSYVTGRFRDTAYFGEYSLSSSGDFDIFVAKIDTDGNWLWATKAGGFESDYGRRIVLDDGNCYLSGQFYGTATFGSSSITSYGGADVFVAKMDANGNWLWANKAGGISWEDEWGLGIDDFGNCYVTGTFNYTATFGSYSLTTSGDDDVFLAKVDTNGNWLWATKAGGSGSDCGMGIAIDNYGYCCVTGIFQSTASFGTYTLVSSGDVDAFVAKVDSYGNWLWATKAGGGGSDYSYGIATDDNDNIYVTGRFYHTAIFGDNAITSNGSGDIFIAMMDTYGNWLWANKAGGSDSDKGNRITVDENGNSYVTGIFFDTATFGSHSLTGSGGYEVFIAKMDLNGNWLWVTQAGGSNEDQGFGIAINNNGDCYVTGYFYYIATFGSYTITTGGGQDIFVAKFGNNTSMVEANFSVDPSSGYAPLEVSFTDLSTGNPTTWLWDFNNDGFVDSNVQSPIYNYYEEGVYTVSLTVSNGMDTDTVVMVDYITVNSLSNNIDLLPIYTKLYQNYPNPFNPTTYIGFDIKENETGIFSIYNVKGQIMETQQFESGKHNFLLNASKLASGIYFYQLHTQSISETRKMLLLK